MNKVVGYTLLIFEMLRDYYLNEFLDEFKIGGKKFPRK